MPSATMEARTNMPALSSRPVRLMTLPATIHPALAAVMMTGKAAVEAWLRVMVLIRPWPAM